MSITVKTDLHQFFSPDISHLIHRTSLLQQNFLFNMGNPQTRLFLLNIKTQTYFAEYLIVYQRGKKRLESILLNNVHQNNSLTVS